MKNYNRKSINGVWYFECDRDIPKLHVDIIVGIYTNDGVDITIPAGDVNWSQETVPVNKVDDNVRYEDFSLWRIVPMQKNDHSAFGTWRISDDAENHYSAIKHDTLVDVIDAHGKFYSALAHGKFYSALVQNVAWDSVSIWRLSEPPKRPQLIIDSVVDIEPIKRMLDDSITQDAPKPISATKTTDRAHSHYFKDVTHLNTVDVYRVLDLFDVKDQAIGHAAKKLLVMGGRGGGKDMVRDIDEAIDTLVRWKEMQLENKDSQG